MGRRVLFLGPPGVGKGTQAALLATTLGVPHVSTGVMLREAVAAGTDLGKQAEAIMAAGDLVPDDLVVAIVDERLSREDAACGYLLDGFPRNAIQAEALERSVPSAVEVVLLLEAPEEELVGRLLKRAADEGRADDNEDTIRRRLQVYLDETEPLITQYGGLVVRIDGVGSIEEVFSNVALALAGRS
jgi:adenylate kinase